MSAVKPSNPIAKLLAPALAEAAPTTASLLAFAAGAATIISAANPSNHPRAADVISLITVEAPNMLAALLGVAQMALAYGLRRRVDASMWMAASLSVVAAVYFVLHHERYVDAGMQLAFAGFLVSTRHAFYRRARAFSLKLPPLWFAAVSITILIASIGGVLWASTHRAFRTAPWWSLFFDPIIGRAGRPVAVAAVALFIVAIWRYIATVRVHQPPPPGVDDFSKAETAIAEAVDARPEAMLTFTGDLSLKFSESGRSFISYSVFRSSMIALGGPTGQPEERRALLSAFCKDADEAGLKPVIYAAPSAILPDLLDLGFKVEKIGENAVIPLADFSLAGKSRQDIRYANRKLTTREGAVFEMHYPPHPPAFLEKLRPVSDAWLKAQGSGEKRFSLGRFEEEFLNRCPVAEASIGGKTIAFGSILATPGKEWAALDLMRYDQDLSPPATMDFLLSEILLWAKDAGYQKFDLSMAPLSGLAEESQAPLFARLGRLIYEQGGRWYNFEGLRRFKQKFSPDWAPRYLASKGTFSLPVALAEIAMLTNSASPEKKLNAS
ncbi:MAG: phosphatidylglycerol lysyltransferase domain-containing protein [Parvularculaceae bacterium]